MDKRGVLLLFIFIFVFSISIATVYSQEEDESDIISEIEAEYPDAELEVDAGIGPDNFFYFIDNFFDRFGDELRVREEKIAEIREMIREGNIGAAREALERYLSFAEELEREIDPEKRDAARRSAAGIRRALLALESDIPPEFREEFINSVLEREEAIVTAVEIASKIKELCETLSELDPLEYSRTCKTDDDSPRWHVRLDRDLTEEQRQEAEAFFEIMLQCFETSGGTCRCEDISFTAFAEKCSVIAPLAYACEVEDNEVACDRMDEIEDEEPIEDLLPDYLREVLRDIEDRFEDERFEHYGGPKECEGITDRAQCEELIFRSHAPPECVEELFEVRGLEFTRDYGIGEAERDCEKIMFQLFAPQECIEQGITDFRECGRLMFRLNAPQECLAAGLTGEHRGDERECRDIIGELRQGGFERPGGANCRDIEDPEERLRCYDSAVSGVHDFDERYRETRELERQCAERCLSEGGAWDFSNGKCTCHFRDFVPPEPPEPPPEGEGACIDVYEPVCGVDDKTYSNACFARLEDVEVDCVGECPCVTEPPADTNNNTNKTDASNTTIGTGAVIAFDFDNEFSKYLFR